MYSNVTPMSAARFAHASALRRSWQHLHLKLHAQAFGGGSWRVQCTLTGRILGTVQRHRASWWALSPSLSFQSSHLYLADAVLALAAYGRMAHCSERQLRWAKAIRSNLSQTVADQLAGPELLTFWRFVEFEPRCQMSTWWITHRKLMDHFGWEGFKAVLRQDNISHRFMALYRAINPTGPSTPPAPMGPCLARVPVSLLPAA